MSYFKLRECDVISSVFTTNPSYNYTSIPSPSGSSDPVYVFNSSLPGASRTFTDVDGNVVTGSFLLSGAIEYYENAHVSGSEKVSLNRLRNIYASGAFLKAYNYTSSSIFDPATSVTGQTINVISIPQILYGSEIKPGSFTLTANDGDYYTDDSYGGIYSGSILVGCIFYQHGMVWLGSKYSTGHTLNDVAFSGSHPIPTNLYLCRVPRGLLNFSNNSSYVSLVSGSTTSYEISTANPKTFITGIGLYDEDFKLLGVAKVSSPILNEEDTGILFRLKLSF